MTTNASPRAWGALRAWESVAPPLPPLYISMAEYQRCRRARPDVAWDAFFPDIHTTRDANGKPIVMVVEDTPAAEAIREAMIARNLEDF